MEGFEGSIGNRIIYEERFMQVTMRNIIEAYDRPRGLKPVHTHVLGLLAYRDGQTAKQLCEAAHMQPSNISPVCRDLEEAGYLRRERDEHDGRSFRLFLTDEGDRLLRGLDAWLDRTLSCAGGENAELHARIEQGFAAFRRLVELAEAQAQAQTQDPTAAPADALPGKDA